MTVKKIYLEKTAGKQISAIQKEWGNELGDSTSEVSEEVMGRAHDLLQALKINTVIDILCGRSVTQYLGEIWDRRHPSVKEYSSQLKVVHNTLQPTAYVVGTPSAAAEFKR